MTTSETCEMPDKNPKNEEICDILEKSHTVAVVGISSKEDRDSHKVARYLQENGYRIIPVNPSLDEVLGEKAYASLKDIPENVDVVDIFRKPEAIPEVVDSAIAIGAKTVWMQLGLAHHEAAEKAREAGLSVVQNKCMKVEHSRLMD